MIRQFIQSEQDHDIRSAGCSFDGSPDQVRARRLDMAKDTTGRLRVTVKTGGKRKLSSKLWLERQLNDPYVARSKRDGWRSRAAYKLIEMDDKYHFLKPGLAVVDLGAAPGGWSQVAAKRVHAPAQGRVIGIDLLDIEPLSGVEFTQLDFLDPAAPDKLKE
jgi:23S rRNA (uridine2552-2'-O)-methyltransferase